MEQKLRPPSLIGNLPIKEGAVTLFSP